MSSSEAITKDEPFISAVTQVFLAERYYSVMTLALAKSRLNCCNLLYLKSETTTTAKPDENGTRLTQT